MHADRRSKTPYRGVRSLSVQLNPCVRSNNGLNEHWANDKSTLSVRRPIDVVVLKCWVTATNETLFFSKISTNLAKSANGQPIDLVKRPRY
jgi:hypothetical protein